MRWEATKVAQDGFDLDKKTASVSRADSRRRKKASGRSRGEFLAAWPREAIMVSVCRFWMCSEVRSTGPAFSTRLQTQATCWVMVEKHKGGRHSLWH